MEVQDIENNKENKIKDFNKINEQSVSNIKDATEKIVEYIEILEKADTTDLTEERRQKYFEIISKYKNILFKLYNYISEQKPIYKTLLRIIEKYDKTDDNYEKEKLAKKYDQKYKNIDVDATAKILDMVMELQNEVELELSIIKDNIKRSLYILLKKVLITACTIGGCVAIAFMSVTVTTTTFVTVSLISSTAILTFIKLDGLKLLTNIVNNIFQYNLLSEVDKNLNNLKIHLNNIREQTFKLKVLIKEFKEIEGLYIPNDKENIKIINNIINNFDKMENIINDGLK